MGRMGTQKQRTASYVLLFCRLGFCCIGMLGCVGAEVVAELMPEDETDSTGRSSVDTDSGGREDDDGDTEDCGDFVWRGDANIAFASQLKMLAGVTRISGSFFIEDIKDDVDALEAVSSLRCVDGDLAIWNVRELKTLETFANLHTVGGDLIIHGNTELENLKGINDIRTLGGKTLHISDNEMLPTCNAMNLYDEVSELGWDGETCIVDNSPDDCESIYRGCSGSYYR